MRAEKPVKNLPASAGGEVNLTEALSGGCLMDTGPKQVRRLDHEKPHDTVRHRSLVDVPALEFGPELLNGAKETSHRSVG